MRAFLQICKWAKWVRIKPGRAAESAGAAIEGQRDGHANG